VVLFYNLAIFFYRLAIFITSLFNGKAKLWLNGRKNWEQKLLKHFEKENPSSYIWFHCASLGEFEQGRPLMEAIKKKYPSYKIILTFFSPSGYEIRKDYAGADYIAYLPIDIFSNAQKFIEIVKPKAVFFVKYEFWYHYIMALKHLDIPLYLIAGQFRIDQPFFKWYGGLHRKMLAAFTHLYVQQQNSVELIHSIGITHVSAAGDPRYDRCYEQSLHIIPNLAVEYFCKGRFTLMAGSSWAAEEALLNSLKDDDIGIVIAPHDLSRVQGIKNIFSGAILYSIYSQKYHEIRTPKVLIIDNIGMLNSLYQYADVALIGGGFGAGLHNILEAAVFGKPVLYGPNTNKFPEASALVKSGGGFYIYDESSFHQIIYKLKDDSIRMIAGNASANFVKSQTGATKLILQQLDELLA
jgi:3-deoxy-D-manno-octulosonic-acid transferase